MRNANLVLVYLFGALASCLRASIRTREMVARAIAKFLNMVPQ